MKSQKIILILLFILANYAVDATEYHVSVNGNDQASGSITEPFRTISLAAEIARPGDIITVHEGIYRERINPVRGGTNELNRIIYQASQGEEVVIKGSEVINNWQKHKGTVWKAVLHNSFFKDYNPYADLLTGDWLNKKGINHHTGEVFLNGKSLFEKSQLNDVMESQPYPDARNKKASIYSWYCEVENDSTTIWANFQDFNPNKELVEINVRRACFYPENPGINYITVHGFIMGKQQLTMGKTTCGTIRLPFFTGEAGSLKII